MFLDNDHWARINILAHIWRSNMAHIFRQEDHLPNHIFKIFKMEHIFEDSQQFFVDLQRFLDIGIKHNFKKFLVHCLPLIVTKKRNN